MKLTHDTIAYITLFENLTGAHVKDCVQEDDHLLFLIEEGSIQKALKGKARIEHALKKNIRILGYSSDLATFIRNLIFPIKAAVQYTNDQVTIKTENSADRGKVYGRSRERLEKMTSLVQRYFPIKTITVE